MASSYLTRQTTVPTSERTFTFSTWMKVRGVSGVDNGIIEWYRDSNDRYSILIDSSTSQLRAYGVVGGSNGIAIYSNMTFRDPSSWYHVCIHNDTTQGSASDRFKLWVNGVAQTFASYTFSFSGSNINVMDGTSGDAIIIGTRNETASNSFNGSLADTYYVDGSLIAYTEFGETDSTTGQWKPKTSPTISSFGNAGFHLTYEDSSNLGDDTSGNSKDMTMVGTITQNIDSPSHNFCTLNASQRSRMNTNNSGDYLINGNTTFDTTSSNGMKAIVNGTLGAQSGKYYWEYKIIDTSRLAAGISTGLEQKFPQAYYDETEYSAIMMNTNGTITGRYTGSAADEFGSGTSNTTNDIIGVALDMDNKALYIHKNGTYISNGTAVGVPTSGSSRTGSLIEGLAGSRDDYIPDGEFVFPVVMDISTTGGAKAEFNFGNGYFGTTAISSEGTNASGIGKFEYDVPANYTALSTRGLNE